jgi:ATP adenylyltransferase
LLFSIKISKIMETLWSPWRSKYIDTFKEEAKPDSDSCFFCDAIAASNRDEELLVVARYEYCFVIMNRYPYNNGHLLIAPCRHIGFFNELNQDEMLGIMQTIDKSIKVLNECLKPHGFNIGANLGREAGAGVPGHLHFHVVPRWNGDTSFMPVLADIKIVSQALEDNQKQFARAFIELV